MPLFKAVRILSSGLKMVVLNEAGERWAQGCLCRACCSEEREGHISGPGQHKVCAVGARDAGCLAN